MGSASLGPHEVGGELRQPAPGELVERAEAQLQRLKARKVQEPQLRLAHEHHESGKGAVLRQVHQEEPCNERHPLAVADSGVVDRIGVQEALEAALAVCRLKQGVGRERAGNLWGARGEGAPLAQWTGLLLRCADGKRCSEKTRG